MMFSGMYLTFFTELMLLVLPTASVVTLVTVKIIIDTRKLEHFEFRYNAVSRKITRLKNGRLISNFYFSLNHKPIQIDYLYISTGGVYVLCNLPEGGLVKSNENHEKWTMTKNGYDFNIPNPLIQNERRIAYLQKLLRLYPNIKYHSLLICPKRTRVQMKGVPIIRTHDIVRVLKKTADNNLNLRDIDNIHSLCLEIKQIRDMEIQSLDRGKKPLLVNLNKQPICPRCGRELVSLSEKPEVRYECSNPRCTYQQ